ncbi:MAG: Multimodular transpeptidase-transglycosylase [Myxococcales bacterium]|nr:Multimodular transpeptidase-transglycosylase [Myxococcales bacterium]
MAVPRASDANTQRVSKLQKPGSMPSGSTMKMWSRSRDTESAAPRSGAPKNAGKPAKLQKPPVTRRGFNWFRLAKWVAILGLAGLALMAATVAFVFWMYGRDPNLPTIGSLGEYRPKQVTTVLDANDRRIGEIFTERRTYVPYEQIPPLVIDAFIAAEDNNFWTHGGVDYVGMFRAFITNLRAGGRSKQGASTITQQVVKTFLLTPEKTFKRKIQEIILARRLEHSLTKQEIMALYLNQIFFGHGRYGIQEAARFYFGKNVDQLNAGEAAMLAALPKGPNDISPRRHPERAKERQIYVLNQMVRLGKLTPAEAQKFIDGPIQVVKEPFPELGTAPEWVDLARKELIAKKGEKGLDTLGATVRTTLDPGIQAMAQRALQAGLRAVDKRHSIGRAVRSLKGDKADLEIAKLAKKLPSGGPKRGEVYNAVVTAVHDDDKELEVDLGHWTASVALSGEEDARFNPLDADGKVKLPTERFKVGDVVEVMLASAAPKIEKTAAAVEDDDDTGGKKPVAEPVVKHAQHRVAFAPGPEGAVVVIEVKTRKVRALVGGYASKVAGFNRATMAKRQPGSSFKPFVYTTAIDSGKYTAASRVNDAPEVFEEHPTWKPKNFETGQFEGPVLLRHALAKSINTVSLRIAYEVKPEVIAATAHKMGVQSELQTEMSLALGAAAVTPLEMTNGVATLAAGGIAMEPQFIEAIEGKPMDAPKGEQVIRPEVAYVVTNMMQSVIQEGTGAKAQVLHIPVAGKTGTSNEARDTWFIGLTPDYAIGVWIGYDDNRPMGHQEQGGVTAVPVYVDIMKGMAQPAKPFPRPPHVVEKTIDRETGLLAPEGAPKGTTLNEVFVEGSEPTEVAPKAGEVTEGSSVTGDNRD